MYLNKMYLNKKHLHSPASSRQGGSALVIAIFVITVAAALGVVMHRVLEASSRGVISEVYGAKAYQAAQSGIDIFLVDKLFPIQETGLEEEVKLGYGSCEDRGHTAIGYTNIKQTSSPMNYSLGQLTGLQNCKAEVYCDKQTVTTNSSTTAYHFRILSVGTCETGQGQVYSRQLLVEAKDEIQNDD